VPLDSSTDFAALSAKLLKQLVKDHGIECKGATEKADFVGCLRRHVAASAGGSQDGRADEL
jgi:protein disulfide-isomerase A6